MNKILGLDVGDVWIGVAISDALLLTAQPLMTIKRESNKIAYEKIHEIIIENNVEKVVVGLPKNMNTLMAEQVLIEGSVRRENRKKYIDKIAATYILQSYLDRLKL